MKCTICTFPMQFFLSKKFNEFDLNTVAYLRCPSCGFVQSKTHAEMTIPQWEKLNYCYHDVYQGSEWNNDDPNWKVRLQYQADIIADCAHLGLINTTVGNWLDYACGAGELSAILRKNHSLTLKKFDRYMAAREDYLSEEDLVQGRFDFVISTSVFEHLLARNDFDFIDNLVSDHGVLGLHTLVCEEVPKDSSWFYFLPVHCSFFTNRSAQLLFEQWGYQSSIYNVDSRLWLWFRDEPDRIETLVEQANARSTGPRYLFKRGFVDYWTVKPHRTTDHSGTPST